MDKHKFNPTKINILVVDDTRTDLNLLSRMLTMQGYTVHCATKGSEALQKARALFPDLILLDIMLPDISGYEVCQKLKSEEETNEIPIVFISALSESPDKVKAFSNGGVDYITKPFDIKEVLARTQTHLFLSFMKEKLQQQNSSLKKEIIKRKEAEAALRQKNEDLTKAMEQLRATQAELIQTEKMATLGQLTAGIAHEINTPLGAIQAAIENISMTLKDSTRQLPKILHQLSREKQQLFFDLLDMATENEKLITTKEERKRKRKLRQILTSYGIEKPDFHADILSEMGLCAKSIKPFLPLLKEDDVSSIIKVAYTLTQQQKNSHNIDLAVRHASNIVIALKNYVWKEHSGNKTLVDVSQTLDTILTIYHNQMKHGVELIRDYEKVSPITCYAEELLQIWTNLIHNALQAMGYKGILKIILRQVEDYIVVKIIDDGPGIPPEIRGRIFEPFFTTKSPGKGSGLGLDIVRQIIDKHQGQITFETEPEKTAFIVHLPISNEDNS